MNSIGPRRRQGPAIAFRMDDYEQRQYDLWLESLDKRFYRPSFSFLEPLLDAQPVDEIASVPVVSVAAGTAVEGS